MNIVKKSGFTLVEILVAVFILAIILVIAGAATNLMVGRLRSKKTTDLNIPVRNAFDIISQKMNTANARLGTVYGFNEKGGILEIVNKSDGGTTCTTIGKAGTVLKMQQSSVDCDDSMDADWQAITPDTIEVTAFTPIVTNAMITTSQNDIPTAQITITAREKGNSENQITIQTSYYLDYQTVNNLK